MVRCHQRLFSRRIPSAWSSGIAPRGRGNFWRVFRRTFTTIDDKTRTELEAAVFRRVVSHLRSRTDVQNIEMMDLTGFCRNCLASWMLSEAEAVGLTVTRDEGLRAAQTPRNRSKCFVHSSRSRPSHDEDGTRPCPSSQSINRHTWASPINPRVKGKAASMLAEKQLPTPQKQSRIQKHPSRRPSGLRNRRIGSACQNLQTPCPWALAICAKAMYRRRHTDRPMGRFRRRK
jgi:Protein of unknown function (DUF1244)